MRSPLNHIQSTFSVPYTYSIYFGRHIFRDYPEVMTKVLQPYSSKYKVKVFVVLEQTIADKNPEWVSEALHFFNQQTETIELAAPFHLLQGGENIKMKIEPCLELIAHIDQAHIDRQSYVLAIGGGALLDMVGLATTLAHRGVRLIRMPSTVLSQDDSGVGVKNSINYLNKKNLIGTFMPPYAVINDFSLLDQLPIREKIAGLAEAVKVALIKDLSFFEYLEANALLIFSKDTSLENTGSNNISSDKTGLENTNTINTNSGETSLNNTNSGNTISDNTDSNITNLGNTSVLESVIMRCAQLHAAHIASGDPFELSSARPLDFGHWSAHKLEVLSQYEILHGEAVAIGIALDTVYSFKIGWISEKDILRVISLLMALKLPIYHPLLNSEALYLGLEEFREHLGGTLTLTLLRKLGKGEEVHEMHVGILRECVAYLASV